MQFCLKQGTRDRIGSRGSCHLTAMTSAAGRSSGRTSDALRFPPKRVCLRSTYWRGSRGAWQCGSAGSLTVSRLVETPALRLSWPSGRLSGTNLRRATACLHYACCHAAHELPRDRAMRCCGVANRPGRILDAQLRLSGPDGLTVVYARWAKPRLNRLAWLTAEKRVSCRCRTS